MRVRYQSKIPLHYTKLTHINNTFSTNSASTKTKIWQTYAINTVPTYLPGDKPGLTNYSTVSFIMQHAINTHNIFEQLWRLWLQSFRLFLQTDTINRSLHVNRPNTFYFRDHLLYFKWQNMITDQFTETMHVHLSNSMSCIIPLQNLYLWSYQMVRGKGY